MKAMTTDQLIAVYNEAGGCFDRYAETIKKKANLNDARWLYEFHYMSNWAAHTLLNRQAGIPETKRRRFSKN